MLIPTQITLRETGTTTISDSPIIAAFPFSGEFAIRLRKNALMTIQEVFLYADDRRNCLRNST